MENMKTLNGGEVFLLMVQHVSMKMTEMGWKGLYDTVHVPHMHWRE